MPFDYYAPGMENLFCQMTLMQKAVSGMGQTNPMSYNSLAWTGMSCAPYNFETEPDGLCKEI